MTKINNIDLQEKPKFAMSVAENIDTALSKLWQLAVAMASLKHIAGMQEDDLASASSAGQEDDHSQLPETHRHSHVEETEASGDDSFANMENKESEEIELAALISSLTLTMVCQQNKAPGVLKVSVTEGLFGNDVETEPVSIPVSSMIGHQLSEVCSPSDMAEIPLSMAAHVVSTNIEEDGRLCDTDVHYEAISEISTLTIGKQTETNFAESEVSTSSPEENLTIHEISLCTHKLSCLETPLPLSDYQVSMVAHQHSLAENNIDSGSLVSHQTPPNHKSQQHHRKSTQMTKIEINPAKVITDSTFSTSLLAHQVETSFESSEFPVSMVAHMINPIKNEDTLFDTNENVSMVAHQIENDKTSATANEKSFQTVDKLRDVDEESYILKESKFISTLCSHQLSPIQTLIENNEYPVSLSVHTVDSYSEDSNMSLKTEHGMISSMVSHQSCKEEKLTESLRAEEISVENLLNIVPTTKNVQIDQLSKYYSSVAHQLPSKEADGEFLTCLVSAAAHGVRKETNEEDIIESDSGLLTSIVSHQCQMYTEDVVDDVSCKEYFKCLSNTFISPTCGTYEEGIAMENLENTNSLRSMAAQMVGNALCEDGHQEVSPIIDSAVEEERNEQKLVGKDNNSYTEDSQRRENYESAPRKEEYMTNHDQGVRPVEVEEEHVGFCVTEAIAQPFDSDISIYDNQTQLNKILSHGENEIDEFKIKRKNIHRISENNVETTETQITNNFKGVEFKSCVTIHQQLDGEYESKDPEDIIPDEDSVSSLVTTTEKINHLSSENASENLIAASCTIEDNSPVVITTSNQIMDETERIASRETETLKNNHQATRYEKNQEGKITNSENKETRILRSFSTETKANGKLRKKEKPKKSSTEIATFNANSGKQTYKIRFKVKPNEDPSKSSVLTYLLGYFGGQQ